MSKNQQIAALRAEAAKPDADRHAISNRAFEIANAGKPEPARGPQWREQVDAQLGAWKAVERDVFGQEN